MQTHNKQFLVTPILLCCITGLWFIPASHAILKTLDEKLFLFLNNQLLVGSQSFYFWGMLNHRAESWINLIVMITINLICLSLVPGATRKRSLLSLLYFWGCFQVALLLVHFVFSDLLAIRRNSPAIDLYSQAIVLSQVLANSAIKDQTPNCFPAGHTLVFIYWACFSSYIMRHKRYLTWFISGLAIFMCFPRLVVGAHWVSDVIFTTILAIMFYQWAQIGINKLTNKQFKPHSKLGLN